MKPSPIVIAGLLAVIVPIGWLQDRKIRQLTAEYVAEEARAAELGLVGDFSAAGPAVETRRLELRQQKDAAKVTALLGQVAQGNGDDTSFSDEDLLDLTEPEIKLLSVRLLAGDGIAAADRVRMVRALARLFAGRYPDLMLKLYTADPEFSAGRPESTYLVAWALKYWAAASPLAAADWAREETVRNPGLMTTDVRLELLSGIARTSAGLSISLVAELGLEGEPRAWSRIGEAVKTPGEWTSLVAALRAHRQASPEDGQREAAISTALAGLSRSVLASGFGDASNWLAGACLDEKETVAFANELHPWFTKKESGEWLDWMGANLKGGQLADKTGEIISEWTRKDYAAAGAWLQNQPAGPQRDAAILGYADALAAYEPAVASKWALLLPANEDRRALAKKIRSTWQAQDPAAAADFAREAGLPEP